MKNNWRAYIKPFDDFGDYQSDWIEVTKDVDFESITAISSDLDNTEYDIGIYRNSSFKVSLNNHLGKYSDVGSPQSIFKYKRADSLFKLTWEIEEEGARCGMAFAGETYLSTETDVFIGMINDDSYSFDLTKDSVSFTVLGRESTFSKVVVPYSSISNGELISSIIYKCLNQTAITDVLTVSVANISLSLDQVIDDITSLENQTVQEALRDLLLVSNSVLWIDGDSIKVSPRTAGATSVFTFYGQAASAGAENIQAITDIKNGNAKLFNLLTWRDVSTSESDSDSILRYGVKKKELSVQFITNATRQQNILAAVLAEFKDPKQEFTIATPLTYPSLAIKLLNRCTVDYPTVYVPNGFPLPICGAAVCGTAVLPDSLWGFTITPPTDFKVIGRSLDVKNALFKFKMRAI